MTMSMPEPMIVSCAASAPQGIFKTQLRSVHTIDPAAGPTAGMKLVGKEDPIFSSALCHFLVLSWASLALEQIYVLIGPEVRVWISGSNTRLPKEDRRIMR